MYLVSAPSCCHYFYIIGAQRRQCPLLEEKAQRGDMDGILISAYKGVS